MKQTIWFTILAIILATVVVAAHFSSSWESESDTRKVEWIRDPAELREISETSP